MSAVWEYEEDIMKLISVLNFQLEDYSTTVTALLKRRYNPLQAVNLSSLNVKGPTTCGGQF